ncbi:hypothetical protein SAMN05216417_101449 [Nitrosospira multiformis]|uniref:Uncharacterized protein n=1 Tax=Nitrosospira multiformis TaxID=1231 RepID=A0A1I7FFY5_9PROT|nr:hypothetical protein SAMN05216417_101449 [Nitrosospira multiformis]
MQLTVNSHCAMDSGIPRGSLAGAIARRFPASRLCRTLALLLCVEYHWEQVSQYASHNPDDE